MTAPVDPLPTPPAAHAGIYAQRFNARAIQRPRPRKPYVPLTDAEIAALPTEHARNAARIVRTVYRMAAEFNATCISWRVAPPEALRTNDPGVT